MTDYYSDFTSFTPEAPEEIQSHQLMLMARFLRENALLPMDFEQQQLAPPASREVVANLPEMKPTEKDDNCTICLKPNAENEPDVVFKVLPCKHAFHSGCILPWLEKTNSCPLCRFELKTDDIGYEESKKYRLRQRQREEDLECLHNSMFG